MTLDNRHRIALPYWARPGIATFAKKVDDDDEGGNAADEDDDDEEEDDDEEDDDLADLSEDELRAELKKTRESLSKASGSSKLKRDRIKRLRAELTEARKPKPAAKKKDDDDDAPDVEVIKSTAKAEAQAAANAVIRKTAARAELKAAGIAPEQVGRLVGMLDLDELDVDDDGNVDGLDEAIAELKADWPQLFASKPAKRQRASVAGGGDQSTGPKKRELTPSQIQANRVLGKKAS